MNRCSSFWLKDNIELLMKQVSMPAMRLYAKTAAVFQSDIGITYQDNQADLKSIMGVMSLGLPNGTEFNIDVSGTDEQEAMHEMDNIITKEGFAV